MNALDSIYMKMSIVELNEFIDQYCGNEGLTYSSSNMRTKSGKEVLHYKIEDNNNGTADSVYFIQDKATNTVVVEQYKFGTKLAIPADQDILEMLFQMAVSKKGEFKGIVNDQPLMVVKGNRTPAEISVVRAGTKGQIHEEDDGTGISTSVGSFKVLKPIKQFLEENPDLYNNLKGMSFPDNFNALGKYLLKQKVSGDMEFIEFKDLFGQIMILGANDPKLKQFWTILS